MANVTDASGGGTHLVTAYFEDRSDAVRAMERLSAAGIAEARVTLTEGGAVGGEDRGGERGFLEMLADLFIPHSDRHGYAEGLRRGGFLVSARVDDADYDRAVEILDDEGSIDIGEREQSWRSEGWTGYGEDASESYADLNPDPDRYHGQSTIGSTRTVPSRTPPDAAAATPSAGAGPIPGRIPADVPDPMAHMAGEPGLGVRDLAHGRTRVRSYRYRPAPHEERIDPDVEDARAAGVPPDETRRS